MIGKRFESEALRVNLERTQLTELRLPPEHAWLLEIAGGQFGVHRRLDAFLGELHHPFPNAGVLVADLRTLALSDLWFYLACPDPRRAVSALTSLFEQTLAIPLTSALRERLAETLLELAVGVLAGNGARPEGAAPLAECAARLLQVLDGALVADLGVLARASSFIKALGEPLRAEPATAEAVFGLLRRALEASLDLWEAGPGLEQWYAERREQFEGDHAARMASLGRGYFAEQRRALAEAGTWEALQPVDDFKTIAGRFRSLMEDVDSPFDRSRYILYLLRLPGVQDWSDQLLWDLNRTFRSLQGLGSDGRAEALTEAVFEEFRELAASNMGAVLDCVLSLGRAAYASGDRELVERFLDRVIGLGFVKPSLGGIGEDWQLEVDPNHIKNARVWIELIACNPEWSVRLISALIIHLKVGGVFMADTDLFQRDVTRLLNARIEPCFKLVVQLCKLFPVYFDELGAEGELRDVTTRMDELSHREDRLIHFLRKQVHAESNSTHIALNAAIARFWHSGDPEEVVDRLPEDVRASLATSGPWFDGVHRAMQVLGAHFGVGPVALLGLDPKQVEPVLAACPELSDCDRERVLCLVRLQGLLNQKYSLDASGVLPQMRRLSVVSGMVTSADADHLEQLLAGKDPERALVFVYELLGRLRAVILDPRPTEGQEDIFHKRHIAVGIPSMYGRYFEPKFAALGLTFRLESLATELLQRVIRGINLGYVSRTTLRHAARVLELFRQGLALAGMDSKALDSHLGMLEYSLKTSSFSLSQFINIFQFIAESVRQIIRDFFLRHHDETLQQVLPRLLLDGQGRPFAGDVLKHEVHRCSESLYRELLSSAFLVTELDSFVASLLEKLNALHDRLSPEVVRRVMSFDLEAIVSPIYRPTPELDNQVFLGAKGYFLKRMHEFGFRVPPGFILTTELFRSRETFDACPELRDEVTAAILHGIRALEKRTGKRLGDPVRPLLLSVRSGAAVSMPGAMNTFLNIGLNDEVVEGLSRQPNYGWTSWDCYRRSLQTWGMAHGIARDEFDQVITEFKRRHGVVEKVRFAPEQMRGIAEAYRALLARHGVHFEQDPIQQVHRAIHSVLDSWDTARAWVYRKRLRIADEWGTAVIVQAMVLGNIGLDSGTGVAFTRDPFASEPAISLYGDFTTTSQGEDVVAGLVHPWPISNQQLERAQIEGGQSLETQFPEIYDELLQRAEELVHQRGMGHQEIEFTFESARREDLYILQIRSHTTRATERQAVFAEEELEQQVLGRGMGIGGGAMNGRVAFDLEDLTRLAAEYPGENRILVRPDTVPDDIGMIFECDGLLTARGGAASHAAVTACRLGKVCVVNCRVLSVFDDRKVCTINGVELRAGEEIAIDGRLGNIYRGRHAIAMSAIFGVC